MSGGNDGVGPVPVRICLMEEVEASSAQAPRSAPEAAA
jgi:hypothetical protein